MSKLIRISHFEVKNEQSFERWCEVIRGEGKREKAARQVMVVGWRSGSGRSSSSSSSSSAVRIVAREQEGK